MSAFQKNLVRSLAAVLPTVQREAPPEDEPMGDPSPPPSADVDMNEGDKGNDSVESVEIAAAKEIARQSFTSKTPRSLIRIVSKTRQSSFSAICKTNKKNLRISVQIQIYCSPFV
jgi:hypothetical protein